MEDSAPPSYLLRVGKGGIIEKNCAYILTFKSVLWGRPKIAGLCRKERRKPLVIVSISTV
jgi:hypothetical protein